MSAATDSLVWSSCRRGCNAFTSFICCSNWSSGNLDNRDCDKRGLLCILQRKKRKKAQVGSAEILIGSVTPHWDRVAAAGKRRIDKDDF
jgi:hypothetical protein